MHAEEQTKATLEELDDLKSALDAYGIVTIADSQGRIIYANDRFCAISQYPRNVLLGQDHRIISSGHHTKGFIQELWARIARGEVWQGEIKNRAKDGTFYWVDTTIVPSLDEQRRPSHYLAIHVDITERKRTEETLRRRNLDLERQLAERTAQWEAANGELEAFSYSMGHDLRAPLRIADGFAQALATDFATQLPSEGRRYLQTIRSSTQRMGALINGLLTFAQLSRQTLHRRPIDTSELVREVLAELGFPWRDRQVEVRFESLPPCSGDPILLKQVWLNLLANALKYTQKKERVQIEIGCSRNEGADTFYVGDNGVGFDLRYASRLFGLFQRFHRPNDYDGVGVGLAIVQRIVRRHGGTTWAKAEVDRGATFYFVLEKGTGA